LINRERKIDVDFSLKSAHCGFTILTGHEGPDPVCPLMAVGLPLGFDLQMFARLRRLDSMYKRNSLPWSCAAVLALLFGFTIPALPQVQVNRTSDSLFLSTSVTPTHDTVTSADCFTIIPNDPGANLALCQEYLAAVRQVTLTLAVDRVVTNASSMNQDGSLQNVDQLKANGVVASCQPLRIYTNRTVFMFGYSVAVNGINVGTVPALATTVNRFCVNPGNLKFGFPECPGCNPTPGSTRLP
jgi:hypothetical protein